MYIVTLSFPPPCRLFICFFAVQPPFSVRLRYPCPLRIMPPVLPLTLYRRPSPSAFAIPARCAFAAHPAAYSLPPPFSVRLRYPCPLRICRPPCRLLFTAALLRPLSLSLPVAHYAARPAAYSLSPPFSVRLRRSCRCAFAARPVACSLPPPFSVRFRYPCRCALCRPFSAVPPLLFLSAAPHCPPFFSSCRLSFRLFCLNALPARDFVL